jgi:hypothetical protein
MLFAAERDADRLCAEPRCGAQDERALTAADVEQRLSGSHTDRAQRVIDI